HRIYQLIRKGAPDGRALLRHPFHRGQAVQACHERIVEGRPGWPARGGGQTARSGPHAPGGALTPAPSWSVLPQTGGRRRPCVPARGAPPGVTPCPPPPTSPPA